MARKSQNKWMKVRSAHGITGYQLDSALIDSRLEITVSAPSTTEALPTVYALDPFITLEMVIGLSRLFGSFSGGQVPPTLAVGVGYPTIDPGKVMTLRARDLTPTEQGFPPELSFRPPLGLGGAERFLRSLVEEIIPGIEARYPVHPTDRTLIGYSFSGLFGLYVLFHRPKTFARYLLVSPSLWWDQEVSFVYEQSWAEQQQDLPARVFLATGAGEEEGGQGWLNEYMPDEVLLKFRQVSNLKRLATRLKSRNYPSLHLDSALFSDEYHLTVFPAALARGLRSLFAGAEYEV